MVIAESDDTIVVEGNHYFPRDSLNDDFFVASGRQSRCPWKGTAGYLDVRVDGMLNPGAAWFYDDPKPAATEIAGRVAFWRGVQIEP